jgi:hypothetical protein
MDKDQHVFEKHHRKCPERRGGACRCSEIYTPPTIPRYQRQLMKQAKERSDTSSIWYKPEKGKGVQS